LQHERQSTGFQRSSPAARKASARTPQAHLRRAQHRWERGAAVREHDEQRDDESGAKVVVVVCCGGGDESSS